MQGESGALLDSAFSDLTDREAESTTKPAVAQWESGGLSIPIGFRFESEQRVQLGEGNELNASN